MKSFHMQNRLKRGHSGGKRQCPAPVYRGQREAGNAMSSTQPRGLNKRYNMDESASANEFQGTFLNSTTDEANTSAPALNLSAEALPTSGQPMAPAAAADQQPIQSQKLMNTSSNVEVQDHGRPLDGAEPGVQEIRAASPAGNVHGEPDGTPAEGVAMPMAHRQVEG